jgi:hypothetical protein
VFTGLIGFPSILAAISGTWAFAAGRSDVYILDVVWFYIIGATFLIPFFLMVYATRNTPPQFRWSGYGPPDMYNLPKGLNAGDIEAHRLASRYAVDPRSPYESPESASVLRTGLESEFIVPPGGGWLIMPKELLEESKDDGEGGGKDVQLHDLGTSFVLEARAAADDLMGVRFQVTRDSVSIFIPSGNNWLAPKVLAKDKDGNRMARLRLHDDVIPNRSWVDHWVGLVRVNMPVDNLYTDDGVDHKELEPVARADAPPDLPVVPIEQKNRPSIYAMRVDDHGDTFEVSISTEPQVRESFKYRVEGNDLRVEFEEVRRRTSAERVQIRAKQHKLLVKLPTRVLESSVNFRLEGDTFHIFLHKV